MAITALDAATVKELLALYRSSIVDGECNHFGAHCHLRYIGDGRGGQFCPDCGEPIDYRITLDKWVKRG